jgi:hypothetical protein
MPAFSAGLSSWTLPHHAGVLRRAEVLAQLGERFMRLTPRRRAADERLDEVAVVARRPW